MLEAWYKNYRQFPLCKVNNIRSHSGATANQHLRCSKERKQGTKEDKGKRTVAIADGEKATLGLK